MKINEIANLQPSKTIIPAIAKKLVKPYKDGNESATQLATKFDFIGKVLAEAKKELTTEIMKEISEGNDTVNGYSLKVSETGVKYDYSKCNDPIWNEYNKGMIELSKMMKEREKFLKGIPYGGVVITDADTGETCKVSPPLKTSSDSPVFTLQK